MNVDTTHTPDNQALYLQTQRGYFVIHPNGDIERTDMLLNPSGEWKMLGLIESRAVKLSAMIPLHQITPEWVKRHRLARYRVVDFDHGTFRTWGEPALNIWFHPTVQDTHYYQCNRQHKPAPIPTGTRFVLGQALTAEHLKG